MPKRKLKKSPTKLTILLFLIGFFLIFLSISWNIYQSRVLSFNQATPILVEAKEISTDPALRIIIPKFNIDLPIAESEIKNGIWEINPSGGSHLKGTANPGEGGNIILYGHNKQKLFGKILKIKPGDQIELISQDGLTHTYQVVETMVVEPSATYVLSPTTEEILTFYTCTGFLDSKRFVIKARPI